MRVEIKIDPACITPAIEIHTNKLTPQLAKLAEQLGDAQSTENFGLVGHTDAGVVLLNPVDILRVYSQGNRVCAATTSEVYRLKMRLYEAEEALAGGKIVRVSSSELVNFAHVKQLDLSFSGTIRLAFEQGGYAFVSRRYVPIIKQMLGI